MMELLLYTAIFGVLCYGILFLCGMAAGSAGWLIAGILAVSVLLAGMLVSYQNTRERLARLEKKLDALLEERGKEETNERSE